MYTVENTDSSWDLERTPFDTAKNPSLFIPSLFFTFWSTKNCLNVLQTLVNIFTEFTKPSLGTQLTKKHQSVQNSLLYWIIFIDVMLLLLSSYYTLCCKQMLVWVFFTKNNSGLRGTCKLVLHAPAVDLESFTSTQEIKKLYSRSKLYIHSTINID